MLTKSFFLVILAYFSVLQVAIIGMMRSDTRFFSLAGINAIILLIFLLFSKEQKQKADPKMMNTFVREKSRYEQEQIQPTTPKSEPSLSESNIEQIKIKINKTKPKAQKASSGIYRFALFLFSLLGGAGLVVLLWEVFDFFSIAFAAFAMLTFLMVVFKWTNLWTKSLFASIYTWLLLLFALGGVGGMLLSDDSSFKTQLYTNITDMIAQLKSEKVEKTDGGLVFTGYESTGKVVDINLSGDAELTGMQEGLISLTGTVTTGEKNSQTGVVEEKAPLDRASQTGIQNQSLAAQAHEDVNNQQKMPEKVKNTNQQVTILDAIKHLIAENNIPLSTSKSVKFSHLSTTSADYPYMKTALERKMIGSTTNPSTLISCDVYMVMKGLAEDWNIIKTADVKVAYRQVAKNKNKLNGCRQGEKVTLLTL